MEKKKADKDIQDIIQNLKDSGCDDNQIEMIIELYKENKKQMCIELEKHREALVDSMNKSGKQIDCLDYLIYKIKNT